MGGVKSYEYGVKTGKTAIEILVPSITSLDSRPAYRQAGCAGMTTVQIKIVYLTGHQSCTIKG